jgi:hypothetical protein
MRLPIALVALLASLTVTEAQQGRRLTPISRTGEAVTGSVTLSATAIRFANGRSLPLALVDANARGVFDTAGSGTVTARIYRVTSAANPVLRNGNTLCGAPVTHLVVYEPSPGGVHLNFYQGTERPAGRGADKLCFFSAYEG